MLNLLAAKAEVVFGLQLVTRHRAPRLAALLGLGVAALAAVSAPSPERTARVVLLVGGTLAAVAASRLLSPGPGSPLIGRAVPRSDEWMPRNDFAGAPRGPTPAVGALEGPAPPIPLGFKGASR